MPIVQETQDNEIKLLTAEAVLHQFMAAGQPLLLAVNLKDYRPRLLTTTDEQQYLVLFSSLEQVKKNQDTATSLVAQEAAALLGLAATANTAGLVLNPWGKRLTLSRQEVRQLYYQYFNLQYIADSWWNSPLHSLDYEELMWDKGEPYDELWLAELLAQQERKAVNVAWWAKEQPKVYRKPPLFMQIWLGFYGLYWLQTIFAAGLNTLYYKEMDEAGIILSAILSVGVFFIFKYLHRFTDWWYQREESRQKLAEQQAWEAAAPQRELQRQIEAQIKAQMLEQEQQQKQREQRALQELLDDLK